jgi:hypothetical protein
LLVSNILNNTSVSISDIYSRHHSRTSLQSYHLAKIACFV